MNTPLTRILIASLVLAWTGLAAAQGPPAKDVSFTYLEGQEVTTIDPAKHTDESALHAVINMYDPLLYPKVGENSMEPGPHVATSWRVTDGGKTYTFQIRKGIKFHDGKELTADDVVFSLQRMLALKKGFSWLWNNVLTAEQVRASGPGTVVFTLNQPYAPFLSTLTQLFIVNRDQVLANKKAGTFGELGDYGEAYLGEKTAGSGSVHDGVVGPGDHARHEGVPGVLARLEARPDHPRDLPDGQGGGHDANAAPGRAGGHDRPVAPADDLRRARQDARHRRRPAAERPALPHRAEHAAGAPVRHPRPEGARPRVRLQDGDRADLPRGAVPARGPAARTGSTATARACKRTGRTSSRPSASWPRPGIRSGQLTFDYCSRPGTRSDARWAFCTSRTWPRSGSS